MLFYVAPDSSGEEPAERLKRALRGLSARLQRAAHPPRAWVAPRAPAGAPLMHRKRAERGVGGRCPRSSLTCTQSAPRQLPPASRPPCSAPGLYHRPGAMSQASPQLRLQHHPSGPDQPGLGMEGQIVTMWTDPESSQQRENSSGARIRKRGDTVLDVRGSCWKQGLCGNLITVTGEEHYFVLSILTSINHLILVTTWWGNWAAERLNCPRSHSWWEGEPRFELVGLRVLAFNWVNGYFPDVYYVLGHSNQFTCKPICQIHNKQYQISYRVIKTPDSHLYSVIALTAIG